MTWWCESSRNFDHVLMSSIKSVSNLCGKVWIRRDIGWVQDLLSFDMVAFETCFLKNRRAFGRALLEKTATFLRRCLKERSLMSRANLSFDISRMRSSERPFFWSLQLCSESTCFRCHTIFPHSNKKCGKFWWLFWCATWPIYRLHAGDNSCWVNTDAIMASQIGLNFLLLPSKELLIDDA